MMPKFVFIVAAVLVLAACQQAPVRDEASYLSRIGIGSTLVLHEGVTVPSGHARVFLQGGSVVAKSKVNRYYPHCNFEVRTVSDGTLRIEPDTFVVTEVVEDQEQVVTRPQPLRVAMLPGGDDNDGGVTLITRFVRHRLSSEHQPGVMRLTCHGGFDVPFYAQTPGIAEIRQALGEVVTLNLAAGDR